MVYSQKNLLGVAKPVAPSNIEADNDVKYFLKTLPLKEKLIKPEVKPLDNNRKDLNNKINELGQNRKELIDKKAREQKPVFGKENQDKELIEEKVKEQNLIAEKEKLAHKYEENLKTKIQEALEKQKSDLELNLKKQFDNREVELNQKFENERMNFNLHEKNLKEEYIKKQNSFSKIEKELQEKLRSQEELELTKIELKKSQKEFELEMRELAGKESNFQVLKNQEENDLELKRKDLDSRFDYFKIREKEEFDKEKAKITERIRSHISNEFHNKLMEAEEAMRMKFEASSNERVKKLNDTTSKERDAINLKEQKLIEESNQKQISLDQIRLELAQKDIALKRVEKLSQEEVKKLKNEIDNLSSILKEKENLFINERNSFTQREQKLIEEDGQKQIFLDQLKAEMSNKNLALERAKKLDKEKSGKLKNEIDNLSSTLKTKEESFREKRNSFNKREQKLIEEDIQKKDSLNQLRVELNDKNMLLERTKKLDKEKLDKSKHEINDLSSVLKEKENNIKQERNALKLKEQKLIAEYNRKQSALNKSQKELGNKILIFEMAEKLNEKDIEKLRDELKNKNLMLGEKQKEIEIGILENQKNLEIYRKDVDFKFEKFKNQENEKFNTKIIDVRKKIFERAHKTLSRKFSMDLRIMEEKLKKQMENKIKGLKKSLKTQSDMELKQRINDKICLLEDNLNSQIAQLEKQKSVAN